MPGLLKEDVAEKTVVHFGTLFVVLTQVFLREELIAPNARLHEGATLVVLHDAALQEVYFATTFASRRNN